MSEVDWSGALLEVSLLGKDIQIRKSAESLVGCLSVNREMEKSGGYSKPSSSCKITIVDRSAFLSIMDKASPHHDVFGSTFLHFVDNRTRMLCPVETLLSLISPVSVSVGINDARAILKRMQNLVQVIRSLSPARELILDWGLTEECIGLDISSLCSVLVARLSGVPLFAPDSRVMAALEKIRNLGSGEGVGLD